MRDDMDNYLKMLAKRDDDLKELKENKNRNTDQDKQLTNLEAIFTNEMRGILDKLDDTNVHQFTLPTQP